jgi:hypothetical protein
LLLLGMIAMAAAVSAVALERSRESSNRAACMNNLKLLGIAAHHYHDTYKSLPPGYWGAVGNGGMAAGNPPKLQIGPGNGPFPQLLPFLNCQKLFDQLGKSILWDPQNASEDFWFSENSQAKYNLAALRVACAPLKFLQCPSDKNTPLANVPDDEGGPGRSQAYVYSGSVITYSNGGTAGDPKSSNAVNPLGVRWGVSGEDEWSGFFLHNTYDSTTEPYNPMSRVNYLPVAGLARGESPFYNQFEGVFTNRSANTLQAINAADGTAHTVMFGETSGQFYPAFGDNTLQANLFAAVGSPTHRGLQQRCAPDVLDDEAAAPRCETGNYTTGDGQKARHATFSSCHPAGVLFCFCDGSVRMMTRGKTWIQGSPDWYLLQQLAGFHDGFHRDTHSLLP